MESADLENRFRAYPTVDENIKAKYADVMHHCLTLATHLNSLVPDGEEKEAAIKRLEEVMMWSNAGIARDSG